MSDLDMRMSMGLVEKQKLADRNRIEESTVMVDGRLCVRLSIEATVPLPEGPLPTPEVQQQLNQDAWARVKAELPSLLSWRWMDFVQSSHTQQ